MHRKCRNCVPFDVCLEKYKDYNDLIRMIRTCFIDKNDITHEYRNGNIRIKVYIHHKKSEKYENRLRN